MANYRHSSIVNNIEKHLPKGLETPTKGSLIAGTGATVEKTDIPSEDGSILIGDLSENTGMKWTSDFVLKKSSYYRDFQIKYGPTDDVYFRIRQNLSDNSTRIGSPGEVSGGKIIFENDGTGHITLEDSTVEMNLPTGVLKKCDTEPNFDVNRHRRLQSSNQLDSRAGIFDELIYSSTWFIDNAWNTMATIQLNDIATTAFASGWVRIELTHANDTSGGESGFRRSVRRFSYLGTVLNQSNVNNLGDGTQPNTRLNVVGDTIQIQGRVSSVGSGAIVFARISIGISSSIGGSPRRWTITGL